MRTTAIGTIWVGDDQKIVSTKQEKRTDTQKEKHTKNQWNLKDMDWKYLSPFPTCHDV